MFGLGVRRVAVVAAVVAALSLLSGCVGAAPKPTPKPTPSATPLFSSDAEALKAAEASYQRYLVTFNSVANGGWVDMAPLADVETGDALKADQLAGQKNRDQGIRTTGTAALGRTKLQQNNAHSVSIYLCLDVSGTRLVDDSGADRTSPDRTEVIPFEARFEKADGELRLSRSDQWSSTSFCS